MADVTGPTTPADSADHFRLLAETLPHIVWMALPDGTVDYYNRRWSEYSGVPTDIGHGWGWQPTLHPDDEQATVNAWQQAVATGQLYNIEHRVRRYDGAYRWHVSRALPLLNEHGQVERWYGTATDIHEQKTAQQESMQRARQQAALADISLQALEAQALHDLMWTATRKVHNTLEVTYSKVLRLLPEGDALLLETGIGWQEGLVGQGTVGTDLDSQAGYTLRSSAPVIVEDLRTETRFHGPALLREHEVISGMSVIIQGTEGAYGVFGVHTTEARTFTQDDINFLQAVANILSEAIRRHHIEAERQALIASLDFERSRFADIFMQVPALIATARGPEHIFELANQPYYQLVGHRDIVGKPVREALPELAGQGFFELLDKVFTTGEPFRGQELPITIHRTPEGPPEQRYVDFIYMALREADGSVSGLLAHGVDVTEQVEARQQVEALAAEAASNLAQLEAVINSMTEGLLVVTPEGVPHLANPAALALLEYDHYGRMPTTLDALLKDFELLDLAGNPLALPDWPLSRALRGEVFSDYEAGVRRRHGGEPSDTVRIFAFGGTPVHDHAGNHILTYLTLRDVTHQRQAEKDRRALDLERAIVTRLDTERRRLGRELHDGIRQQLVGIQMLSQNLQKKLSAKGVPEASLMQEFTELIRDVNIQLRALLNELAPSQITAEHLLPALERAARNIEQWYGISCTLTASGHVTPTSDEMAAHLYHIAQEAMTNAAKHSQASEIRLSITQKDRRLTLQVTDDGVGLPSSFDKAGGMGVTNMRQRAELIGAAIDIEGRPEAGTIMTCRLSVPN